jgi:hypothetical protein
MDEEGSQGWGVDERRRRPEAESSGGPKGELTGGPGLVGLGRGEVDPEEE